MPKISFYILYFILQMESIKINKSQLSSTYGEKIKYKIQGKKNVNYFIVSFC